MVSMAQMHLSEKPPKMKIPPNPPAGMPIRWVVVGTSGSGKSHLARRLEAQLGVVHIELDQHHWLPNWQERPDDEMRQLVQAEMDKAATTPPHGWAVCGGYSQHRHWLWPQANGVVWLNYSFGRTFWRVLVRTLRRIFLKELACNGNRETFGKSFFTKESIIWWMMTTHRRRKKEYRGLQTEGEFSKVQWYEFTHPRQVEAWLKALPDKAPYLP